MLQEFDLSDTTIVSSIQDYLNKNDKAFSDSLVYETSSQKKLLKKEKRNSKFRIFEDKDLFDLCYELVEHINNISNNKYILYKNDITHIKYSDGGYFKVHEDYLSLSSNMVEEYTLIMCVDSDIISGGRTILHINQFFKHKSDSTITPGNVLIFRKDLPHEGEKVGGRKEILTLNLWKIINNDEIIVVQFNDDSKTHLLSVKNILSFGYDTLLACFVRHERSKGNESKILFYTETNYNYNQFRIIADIISGCAISTEMFEESKELLDYYGLTDSYKNILVKNFLDTTDRNLDKYFDEESGLIMCSNKMRYMEFMNTVKELKLPYVPFEIIFTEGMIAYCGGLSGDSPLNIEMQPVASIFGESRNLLFIVNLCSTCDPFKYVDLYPEEAVPFNMERTDIKRMNSIKDENDIVFFCDEYKDCYDGDEDENYGQPWSFTTGPRYEYKFNGNPFQSNLVGCLPEDINIVKYMLSDNDETLWKLNKCGIPETIHEEYLTDWWYLNANSTLRFLPEHLPKILERSKKINLYDRVKDCLKFIPFRFTQDTGNLEHDFCNEQIYGNFTFITVYGLMNMES